MQLWTATCQQAGQPKKKSYKLPRLNQDKTENVNRPIASKEIKSETKNHSKMKSPRPNSLTAKFYQTLKN